MFKNFIIVVLVFILCSLLFQNKENVNILVKDLADTKELVVDGTSYLKESFDRNFNEKKISIDIPSLQIQKEPMIREETFFNEEEK